MIPRELRTALLVLFLTHAFSMGCIAGGVNTPQIGWFGTCSAQGWSADGRTAVGIFTAPTPLIVRWDAKTWKAISCKPLSGNLAVESLSPVVLSPDSRYVAVQKEGGGSIVTDTATGRSTSSFSGRAFGFTDKTCFFVEGSNGTIRLWELSAHRMVKSIQTGIEHVRAASVSPDGRLLVIIETYGKGTLWDVRTGHQLHKLMNDAELETPITFSPNSRYLVTGSLELEKEMPKLATGKLAPGWDEPEGAPSEAAIAQTLQLLVWDTRTGKRIAQRPDHYNLNGGTDAFIFVDNGRKLLSCGAESVDVYSFPRCRRLRSFRGKEGLRPPFALSPDGKTLAVGTERWSLPSFKLAATIPEYEPAANWLAFSPDGSKLAELLNPDSVAVWELNRPRVIQWTSPTLWSIDARLSFLPSNKISVWSMQPGIELLDSVTGKLLPAVEPSLDTAHHLNFTRLSPDGGTLVSGRTQNGVSSLLVWDANTLSLRGTLSPCPMFPEAAFSQDGRWFMAGGRQKLAHLTMLYDLQAMTFRSMPDIVGQYAISKSGLVAGYHRGQGETHIDRVVVVDRTGTRTIADTNCKWNPPIAMSPDGERLAAVSLTGMCVYDIATGSKVLDLEDAGTVTALAFDPKGRWIAGSGGMGVIFWDATTGKIYGTLTAIAPDKESGKPGFWTISGDF